MILVLKYAAEMREKDKNVLFFKDNVIITEKNSLVKRRLDPLVEFKIPILEDKNHHSQNNSALTKITFHT